MAVKGLNGAVKGLNSAVKGLISAVKGLNSAVKGLNSAVKGLDSVDHTTALLKCIQGIIKILETYEAMWAFQILLIPEAVPSFRMGVGRGFRYIYTNYFLKYWIKLT